MTTAAPLDVAGLEAELVAIKAARAEAAEKRAAERAADPARIAAAIAREKRAADDDERFADLVDEHGEGMLRRLNTPQDGMVVVMAAPALVHRRFEDEFARTDHANPKVRTSMHEAAERMIKHCLVYPTRAAFDDIAKRCPAIVMMSANQAYELGRPSVEEDAGK